MGKKISKCLVVHIARNTAVLIFLHLSLKLIFRKPYNAFENQTRRWSSVEGKVIGYS